MVNYKYIENDIRIGETIMPMYPYYIPTKFGDCWPFDTEANVPAQLPPNLVTSLHFPSSSTKEIGRALIFNPVLDVGTNGLIMDTGEIVGLDAISNLIGTDISSLINSDVPVFMGNPVYSNNLSGKNIHYVYIPTLGLAISVIVVLIVCFVIALGIVLAVTVPEEMRRWHELDLALESQSEVGREYTDVDTGETQKDPFDGADIVRVYYRNGDVHVLALNQTGYDFIGGSTAIEREGVDWDELLKDLEDRWKEKDILSMILYLGIGVVGIYAAIKIIPLIVPKRKPEVKYG